MKEQPFPSRTPRIAPYGHWQVITFSRALAVAGEKTSSTRLFISKVWNLMYVIKNKIMYIIRELPG